MSERNINHWITLLPIEEVEKKPRVFTPEGNEGNTFIGQHLEGVRAIGLKTNFINCIIRNYEDGFIPMDTCTFIGCKIEIDMDTQNQTRLENCEVLGGMVCKGTGEIVLTGCNINFINSSLPAKVEDCEIGEKSIFCGGSKFKKCTLRDCEFGDDCTFIDCNFVEGVTLGKNCYIDGKKMHLPGD